MKNYNYKNGFSQKNIVFLCTITTQELNWIYLPVAELKSRYCIPVELSSSLSYFPVNQYSIGSKWETKSAALGVKP